MSDQHDQSAHRLRCGYTLPMIPLSQVVPHIDRPAYPFPLFSAVLRRALKTGNGERVYFCANINVMELFRIPRGFGFL